jgi:hypothetical protein
MFVNATADVHQRYQQLFLNRDDLPLETTVYFKTIKITAWRQKAVLIVILDV